LEQTEKRPPGRARQYDFTKGGILKPMLIFSLPILLGNVFNALYNVVDSVVVGQFVGSGALAAVNASFAIHMICGAVFAGFGMGSTVLMGQIFGAHRYEDMNRAAATALIGALIVGSAMSIIGLLIARPLLILIRTPADILDSATVYLRILMLGCITQLFYFMSSGILRGIGDSKHPMIFLIVCAVMNILLDLLFVAVFQWGVAGVAAATVLAQLTSAVLGVHRLLTGGYGITLTRKTFRVSGKMLRAILRLGIPISIQQMANSVGLLIIQSFSNSFGTFLVAANGVHQKVDSFAQLPIMAMGETITSYNAQNVGAGEYERVRRGNRSVTLLLGSAAVAIGAILYVAVPFLYRLFLKASDPGFDQVLEIGVTSVRINAFFYWAIGLQWAFSSILRGVGASRPAMIVAIVCTVIRIPITYLLAMTTNWYPGLYWANNIYFILMLAGMFLYYKFGKWERFAVVRRESAPAKEEQA